MPKPLSKEPSHALTCAQRHDLIVSASQLERLIRSDEHECRQCGTPLEFSNEELTLECHICQDVFAVTSLADAQLTVREACPSCNDRGFNERSIHVCGSWYYLDAQYEWMRSGKDGESLVRNNREDYWEGVIHFCDVVEFGSIYRDRCIRACETGYFRAPAVCLTDATVLGWSELRDIHGEFGFVFRKADLIRIGGGPALYLSEDRIKAQEWHASIKPLVNLLRIRSPDRAKPKHDYLHEREWRTPGDIDFGETPPFAVIPGEFNEHTHGWPDVFSALMEYEELLVPTPGAR